MDFCIGRITRPHTDVDWYVEDGHATSIVAELIADGWTPDDRLPIERQADLSWDGIELSVSPVRVNDFGLPTVGPGPWEGEPLPRDMLTDAGRSTLAGVAASFISPMAQIELKVMMRHWRPELPFREKDEQDAALLCRHLFHPS
ncbi:MAG: aminoglycoside adenylyltransferase [Actinomycetota bacterium]|nr:aminoglycoside adenylyltransferase [Actinomycetota bacterium]